MCFDGTDNNFGKNTPSNVLKLYKMLDRETPSQQTCYYQRKFRHEFMKSNHFINIIIAGIGNHIKVTFGSIMNGNPLSSMWQHALSDLDSAFAYTVDYHVIHAYKFLTACYHTGDKIYLFGFSRGSFIARILAGMIEKIGLLDRSLQTMVSTAWTIYQKWELEGHPSSFKDNEGCFTIQEFKRTFCRQNVSIEFMGLWDSVNSCGILRDKMFPYTSNTHHVKHIRHAISINERRSKFKQNLFIPEPKMSSNSPITEATLLLESESSSTPCSKDVLEVWFPGDHADIGGLWNPDSFGQQLSNIPFRWMLSFALEFGVLFKNHAIDEFSSKFTPLSSVLSLHHDCLSLKTVPPIDIDCADFQDEDELFSNEITQRTKAPCTPIKANGKRGTMNLFQCMFWWFVEVLPLGYYVESKNGSWNLEFYPNFGRSRVIPRYPKVHWSILWRVKFVSDQLFDNLPLIYKQFFSLLSNSADTDADTIISLDQLIDWNSGALKTSEIQKIVNNNKVRLQINWDEPPDDLNRNIWGSLQSTNCSSDNE